MCLLVVPGRRLRQGLRLDVVVEGLVVFFVVRLKALAEGRREVAPVLGRVLLRLIVSF